ncbi:MAG: hypothetical protein BGO78_03335 [Chloroflexi bacterium 44-23]|nr:MAG: hypothetical protein BGO78_03335 [Chloroflexi bacterium 44-23]
MRMKERIGSLYRLQLIKFLKLSAFDGPILDIGCHDDLILSNIEAPLKIGVDLELKKQLGNKYLFVCADANFLPFKQGVFKQVFLLDVIEHIENANLLPSSIKHVLMLDGCLFLTTPQKTILLNPFFLTKYISRKWGHIYRLGYTQNELEILFSKYFSLEYKDWNAPCWRFFYLLIRFVAEFSPSITRFIIETVFRFDSKKSRGLNGYILMHGKSKETNE